MLHRNIRTRRANPWYRRAAVAGIAAALAVSAFTVGLTTAHAATAPAFNYAEALQKSMFFYEAQQSGQEARLEPGLLARRLRADRRLRRRARPHRRLVRRRRPRQVRLPDGVQHHDAGLGRGGVPRRVRRLRAAARTCSTTCAFVNDYFIKAHPSANVLYGQVGKGDDDHKWWGPAEVMPMARPAYKIDATCGGSDLAGETAAAMAASLDGVPAHRRRRTPTSCSTHAKQLYTFADTVRKAYSDCITDAASLLQVVERLPGRAGLGRDLAVPGHRRRHLSGQGRERVRQARHRDRRPPPTPTSGRIAWDNKQFGAYVLLANLTGKQKYVDDANRWLDWWTVGRQRRQGARTRPAGRRCSTAGARCGTPPTPRSPRSSTATRPPTPPARRATTTSPSGRSTTRSATTRATPAT